jgi:hypothetical protein
MTPALVSTASTAAGTEKGNSMTKTIHSTAVRFCTALLASMILIGGASFAAPPPAFAQQCIGRTERVSIDYVDVAYAVKIDSCKAQELVDSYGDVKDAAGLAGALGAKWWPVGTASGILFAWAWNNQAQVKRAATGGRGVEFLELHGVISQARPQ